MSEPAETSNALYGQPLQKHADAPLADQIHDVLVRAIASGRWTIGERLPGHSEL